MRRIVFAAAALVQCLVMASAATHTVGGNYGWDLPHSNSTITFFPQNNTFYSDWAASQTFAVGDTIVFYFTAGKHDVVEVPRSDFNSCSTANQIGSTFTGSPVSIVLTSPGDRYFFCSTLLHCSFGQRVAISIASTSTAAPPIGSVPGAATALASGGRIAAVAAVVLSLASYLLL